MQSRNASLLSVLIAVLDVAVVTLTLVLLYSLTRLVVVRLALALDICNEDLLLLHSALYVFHLGSVESPKRDVW